MDIVMASDENYVPHLATLIISICENNKDEKLDFHILNGGISNQTLNKIFNIKQKYNNIEFYNYVVTDEIILKKLGLDEVYKDRSMTAYARIFIPELLSNNIHNCLYLDCDGIVLSGNSLKKLFSEKNNYCISGAKDVLPHYWRSVVGMSHEDYVCSGALFWNLDICREMHVTDKLVKFIRERKGIVAAMDQGAINGALKGKIGILHPKYDVLTPFYFKSANELKEDGEWDNYYSQEEINEAKNDPVFVHYTGGMFTRPWQKNCIHPMRDQYIKYRKISGFELDTLSEDSRSLKLKVKLFLFLHLPYINKKLLNIKRVLLGFK